MKKRFSIIGCFLAAVLGLSFVSCSCANTGSVSKDTPVLDSIAIAKESPFAKKRQIKSYAVENSEETQVDSSSSELENSSSQEVLPESSSEEVLPESSDSLVPESSDTTVPDSSDTTIPEGTDSITPDSQEGNNPENPEGNTPEGEVKPNIPQEDIEVPKDDMQDNEGTKDVEDVVIPDLEIDNDKQQSLYYANVNEDVYITISIVNPKSYTILRFTLNGTVYQSYQFEDGSNSTLLVLKVNAGELPGIKEFTLDEMKYVVDETNDIKDVNLKKANTTVKLNVAYNVTPSVVINNESIDFSSYSASLILNDKSDLIDPSKGAKLYLYDGVEAKEYGTLHVGANEINFTGLKLGVVYQYLVSAEYDDLTEGGLRNHAIFKKDFSTTNFCKIYDVTSDKDSIAFNYKVINKGANLGKIIAFDAQGLPFQELAEGATKFTGLLSGQEYEIRIYYTITIEGKDYTYYDRFVAETEKYNTPKLNIIYEATNSELTFEIHVDDKDNLLTIESCKLYTSNGDFISNVDYDKGIISNLKKNASYVLKVEYSYDLNDGNGLVINERAISFSTDKEVPVVKIKPFNITSSSIDFDTIVSDSNNVGHIHSLRLFKAENHALVQDLTNLSLRKFENLTSNTNYIIEVGYIYDLDDGAGSQMGIFTYEVSTAKNMSTFDIELVPSEETIVINTIENDEDNTGEFTKIEVLKDNEVVTTFEEITSTEITVDKLLSGFEYSIKATYTYDLNDLNGVQTTEIIRSVSTIAKQVPTIDITFKNNTYSSFNYNLVNDDPSNILIIDTIELMLGTNKVEEVAFEDIDNVFNNLYSNNKYTINVKYHYDLNDGKGVVDDVYSESYSTLKRDKVVYEYVDMLAGKDFINFDYEINDKDNLSTITSIEIYKDNVLVESLEDLTLRTFKNLQEEAFYTIVTNYEFDLNDGKGVQKDSVSILYGTSGSKIFVNSLEVINNTNPLVGDEVQVRLSMDNPNNLQIRAIYISGERCEIQNDNSTDLSNVIVKFIPDTLGGYFQVEVTGYEYETNGIVLVEELTSTFKEKIIVMGEISVVDFFAISETPYQNFGQQEMYMLVIDNPTGYTINYIEYFDTNSFKEDTIKKYYDFVQIDENHILVKNIGFTEYEFGMKLKNAVICGFNFGIEGAEPITKRIEYVYDSIHVYDEIIHIKTPQDLLKIQEGDYVTSKYFILDNDIDMKGYKWSGAKATGVFNGNNHTIKNLTIVVENESNNNQLYGLFSSFEGMIYDLNMENIYYSITTLGDTVVAGISAGCSSVCNSSVSGNIILNGPGLALGIADTKIENHYYGSAHTVTNCLVDGLKIVVNGGSEGYLVTRNNLYRCYGIDRYGKFGIVSHNLDRTLNTALSGKTMVITNGTKLSYLLYENDDTGYGEKMLVSELENVEYVIETNTDLGTITKNAAVLKGIDVKRDGYVVEWYNNPNFSGTPIDFPYIDIDNLNLYAKWSRISEANPNYKYSSYDYTDSTGRRTTGYMIENFGGLEETEKTFVVGGYYNGLPVIGLSYEAVRFLQEKQLEDGTWVSRPDSNEYSKQFTFYITSTVIHMQNNFPYLHDATIYSEAKFYINCSYDSAYYIPDYLETIIKEHCSDKTRLFNTYTRENNPFDEVLNYAPTNDSELNIDVRSVLLENIKDGYKLVDNNDKYKIEEIDGYRYLIYNDDRYAIIEGRIYQDVKKVFDDKDFRFIEYNNGEFEAIKLLNKNILKVDFTKYDYNIVKLADNLFKGSKLNEIILPNALKEIGSSAFEGTAITSIDLPETVVTLGEKAFQETRSLKTIHLSDAIEEIPSYCFFNSLVFNIDFPKNLKSIGEYAFAYADSENIVLPSGVTRIETFALSYMDYLDYIYIPDTVEYIGQNALMQNNTNTTYKYFFGLKELSKDYSVPTESNYDIYLNIKEIKNNGKFEFALNNDNEIIVLDNLDKNIINVEFNFTEGNVVEIADYIFNDSYKIESIVLPDTLVKIGKNAFNSSSKVKDVLIPNSVEVIGEYAFNVNIRLLSMAENPRDWDKDIISRTIFNVKEIKENKDYRYAVTNDSKLIILECLNKIIRDVKFNFTEGNVVEIANNAFDDCNRVTHVELPNTLVTIGYNAFSSCYDLMSILIPDSVQFIGSNAFATNSHLDVILYYGKDKAPEGWDETIVKFVTFNVKEIKDDGTYKYLVKNNNDVIIIECLSDTITKIDFSIFGGNVVEIGRHAFYNCNRIKNVQLPDTLVKIGEYAFANSYLPYVIIPKSVEIIEQSPFYSSTLIYAQVSEAPKGWDPYVSGETVYGVKEVKNDGTYEYLVTENNEVIIVKCLDHDIKDIKFNFAEGQVVEIGKNAFSQCYSVESITLPDTLLRIRENAFFDCSNTKFVSIPEMVEIIEKGAFSDTTGTYTKLSKVPTGWDKPIARRTIYNAVEVRNDKTNKFEFVVTSSNELILSRCLDKTIASVKFDPSEGKIIEIGNGAFKNCYNLKQIALPDTLIKIGESAFIGCSNLQEILIPKSCVTIAPSAFEGFLEVYAKANEIQPGWNDSVASKAILNIKEIKDTRLKKYAVTNDDKVILVTYHDHLATNIDFTFAEGPLVKINRRAFYGCHNVSVVVVPDTVVELGESAFSYMNGLSTIFIPSSVKVIGDSAIDKSANMLVQNDRPYVFSGSEDYTQICSINRVEENEYLYYAVKNNNETIIVGHKNNLPQTLDLNVKGYKVVEIAKRAFYRCQEICDVILPSTLKVIGASAFYSCSIGKITFNEGLEFIEANAFDNCYFNLITIPGSVKNIGHKALNISMATVYISKGVQHIDELGIYTTSNCNKIYVGDADDSKFHASWTNASDDEIYYGINAENNLVYTLDKNNEATIIDTLFNSDQRIVNLGDISYSVVRIKENSSLSAEYGYIIPNTVTEIVMHYENGIKLFYEGNQGSFDKVICDNKDSFQMFYKVDKVTGPNQWTYGPNGEVDTTIR